MRTINQQRIRAAATIAMVVGAMVLAQAGCYRRVVGARGVGALSQPVQSGYRSDTAADRALDRSFGPPAPTTRRTPGN